MSKNKSQVTGALLAKQFPPVLYVRRSDDETEPIYLADVSPEGSNDEDVAVYELADVKKMKITAELI